MNENGVPVEFVEDDVYQRRLNAALVREDVSGFVAPLFNYDVNGVTAGYEAGTDNTFTVKALYRLGFHWSLEDNQYLSKMIQGLKSLGFFDVNVNGGNKG